MFKCKYMSSDKPKDEQSAALVGSEWLDEWKAEQKLTPESAHEMLRAEFGERLANWRTAHPTDNSWVIPFHYTHEDADNLKPIGGLWIPSDGIQEVINNTDAYIHASATMGMECDLFGTGIDVASLSRPSRLDLQSDVPKINTDRYSLVGSMLREQVEKDFNVIIRPV